VKDDFEQSGNVIHLIYIKNSRISSLKLFIINYHVLRLHPRLETDLQNNNLTIRVHRLVSQTINMVPTQLSAINRILAKRKSNRINKIKREIRTKYSI
jgi:cystathionine beta-lyase family protein involved in aluminum resistance